jgi:hypothetical protein
VPPLPCAIGGASAGVGDDRTSRAHGAASCGLHRTAGRPRRRGHSARCHEAVGRGKGYPYAGCALKTARMTGGVVPPRVGVARALRDRSSGGVLAALASCCGAASVMSPTVARTRCSCSVRVTHGLFSDRRMRMGNSRPGPGGRGSGALSVRWGGKRTEADREKRGGVTLQAGRRCANLFARPCSRSGDVRTLRTLFSQAPSAVISIMGSGRSDCGLSPPVGSSVVASTFVSDAGVVEDSGQPTSAS